MINEKELLSLLDNFEQEDKCTIVTFDDLIKFIQCFKPKENDNEVRW